MLCGLIRQQLLFLVSRTKISSSPPRTFQRASHFSLLSVESFSLALRWPHCPLTSWPAALPIPANRQTRPPPFFVISQQSSVSVAPELQILPTTRRFVCSPVSKEPL